MIGGQHRTIAIQEALQKGVDEYHEIKVYFELDQDQRLDVQVTSNTVIAVSSDLYDRMVETVNGPQLRNWCQEVGLLEAGSDFGDKVQRSGPITVRMARTFITNYFAGKDASKSVFDQTETSPVIVSSGVENVAWDKLRNVTPSIWDSAELKEAGKQFAKLVEAQRQAFSGKKGNVDSKEKALNIAVLSAWAYTAGYLSNNSVRLKRHYELSDKKGGDPLNAAALAKGKHKTDPPNYRGLGYRTDAKERGRLVELFYLQTEKGDGIKLPLIDVALAKYFAKQGQLDVLKLEKKLQ